MFPMGFKKPCTIYQKKNMEQKSEVYYVKGGPDMEVSMAISMACANPETKWIVGKQSNIERIKSKLQDWGIGFIIPDFLHSTALLENGSSIQSIDLSERKDDPGFWMLDALAPNGAVVGPDAHHKAINRLEYRIKRANRQ